MGKRAYYCNKPCEILKSMGDECLIQLDAEKFSDDEYVYPARIIVNTEYISDNKLDLESEFEKLKMEKDKFEREMKISQANMIVTGKRIHRR